MITKIEKISSCVLLTEEDSNGFSSQTFVSKDDLAKIILAFYPDPQSYCPDTDANDAIVSGVVNGGDKEFEQLRAWSKTVQTMESEPEVLSYLDRAKKAVEPLDISEARQLAVHIIEGLTSYGVPVDEWVNSIWRQIQNKQHENLMKRITDTPEQRNAAVSDSDPAELQPGIPALNAIPVEQNPLAEPQWCETCGGYHKAPICDAVLPSYHKRGAAY